MPARLQLVIPCYNEAGRFRPEPFLQLVARRSDIQILFVDDGSTDDTAKILADTVKQGAGRMAMAEQSSNGGKASAVRRGVLAALEQRPEFVGYWDADLASPLEAVPEFIDVLDGNPLVDIVIGSRVRLMGRRIDRRWVRHYGGRLFATAASLALDIGVYDTQCGAKMFRANDAIRQVFRAPFQSRWIFDVEILARYIARNGTAAAEARIYELPLRNWTDVPGSKLTTWRALRAVLELARIWRSTKREQVARDS